MKLAEFVAFGEQLSRDLEARAERYNVRSTLYEILCYESTTVKAYVAFVARGVPVPDDLRESPLLGPWGRGFEPWDEADLIRRTTEFYRELERYGISTKVTLRQEG